jgi:hypothetical protein
MSTPRRPAPRSRPAPITATESGTRCTRADDTGDNRIGRRDDVRLWVRGHRGSEGSPSLRQGGDQAPGLGPQLDQALGCPRPGSQHKGGIRKPLAAAFAQLGPLLSVEALRIGTGRANAERERLPPIVEGPVLDVDRQHALVDRTQPGCLHQLRQLTLASACEPGLILDLRIKVTCDLPEQAERTSPARMIPDARSHDSSPSRHACHLDETTDRILHEVNDELRQGGVERTILERQLLCRRTPSADTMALSNRSDEDLRGVDRRHRGGADASNQLGRQRARPGADVENALTRRDCREVGEPGREGHGIPAHEPVVRVGPDGEAHRRNLLAPGRNPVSPVYPLAELHEGANEAGKASLSKMARAGIEPATPRFSAVCSTD